MRRIAVSLLLCVTVACGGGGGGLGDSPYEPPPPKDMTFEGSKPNEVVTVDDDSLSTFAVDVDTGSYTIARRYVTDGQLPPPDSVRVEEFVNYFSQDYDAPVEEAFAVRVDGASTPFLTDPSHRLLRVGLQSREPQPSLRRRAALTFVVDVSGSMEEGNRLGLVRQSLDLLVENLNADDTVALVTYGSDARVALHPTPVADAATIKRAVDSLRPEGSTNAAAGLELGYQLAREAFRSGDINRVVLASDGVANVGVTDAEQLLRKVRDDADAGIQLVTVGVGMGNYNDVFMEQLADDGDGFYSYVDSFDEAERLFSRELTSTIDVVALDAKIQVAFSPDAVKSYRLVGFENRAIADEDFTNDSVAAGAVGPGHTVTALYEIELAAEPVGSRLGEVRVRWTDPATGTARDLVQPMDAQSAGDTFATASPRLQLDATVAAYAEVLRNSRHASEIGLPAVAEEARRVAAALPGDKEVAEFAQLVRTAAALTR